MYVLIITLWSADMRNNAEFGLQFTIPNTLEGEKYFSCGLLKIDCLLTLYIKTHTYAI